MWKILKAFGITSEESLKRAIVLILGGLVTLLVNPLLVSKGLAPVSDGTIASFAAIVSFFLVQSGLNSAKKSPPGGDS